MIQKINKSAVKKLKEARDKALLTVYVPLEKGSNGYKFNKSQLHNLKSELKKTTSQLPNNPLSSEIDSILQEINHGNELPGVSIFYDGVNAKVYALQFTPKKTIEISTTYDVGQIQDYFSKNLPYYVLTISKNGSQLYEGDMESLHVMPVAGMGKDIMKTLHIDELDTNNIQSHPTGNGSSEGGGLHGQGGYKDVKKTLFDDYLRAIDTIVMQAINDRNTPLVLVSVDYEQSAYKNMSKYPNILAEGVSTNPDELTAGQLHAKTFPLVSTANSKNKA